MELIFKIWIFTCSVDSGSCNAMWRIRFPLCRNVLEHSGHSWVFSCKVRRKKLTWFFFSWYGHFLKVDYLKKNKVIAVLCDWESSHGLQFESQCKIRFCQNNYFQQWNILEETRDSDSAGVFSTSCCKIYTFILQILQCNVTFYN